MQAHLMPSQQMFVSERLSTHITLEWLVSEMHARYMDLQCIATQKYMLASIPGTRPFSHIDRLGGRQRGAGGIVHNSMPLELIARGI